MIFTDNKLSRDITEFATADEAINIVNQLEWELKHSAISGIGLAAPQIGINKAVAIIRIKNPHNDSTNPILNVNLVNPILIEATDLIQYNEGCLSFPGMSAKTLRYNEIVIETMDDYDYHVNQINHKRLVQKLLDLPLLSNNRRRLYFGEEEPGDMVGKLVSVCVQHEFSHLLGLTMFDFSPHSIGRNELCPCGSNKKNKKCHNYDFYNKNLERLFSPHYKMGNEV